MTRGDMFEEAGRPYVLWIEDAKTAETRARRIAATVEKVARAEPRQ